MTSVCEFILCFFWLGILHNLTLSKHFLSFYWLISDAVFHGKVRDRRILVPVAANNCQPTACVLVPESTSELSIQNGVVEVIC
jgi:hypothetical protein